MDRRMVPIFFFHLSSLFFCASFLLVCHWFSINVCDKGTNLHNQFVVKEKKKKLMSFLQHFFQHFKCKNCSCFQLSFFWFLLINFFFFFCKNKAAFFVFNFSKIFELIARLFDTLINFFKNKALNNYDSTITLAANKRKKKKLMLIIINSLEKKKVHLLD